MDDAAIVDDLAAEWRTIDELCSALTPAQWAAPTDCPLWSVQDNLAHIAGTESWLLGRKPPAHRPANAGTLTNDLAERNEVEVDYRRAWPGERVLADFREVTAARLAALRAMDEAAFGRETDSPLGKIPYRDFMRLRLFDCWVHEQDIRRALGQPGNLDGSAAGQAVARMARSMSYVIGKRVGAPDGTSVVFSIAGAAGGTFPIEVRERRAYQAPVPVAESSVRLIMDVETFILLTCGRASAQDLLASGRLRIEGDQELGRQIAEQANVMI